MMSTPAVMNDAGPPREGLHAAYPLEAWLLGHHPYEVPEILALPVDRGSKPYLDWVRAQT